MGDSISFMDGLMDCYEGNYPQKGCEGCQYLKKCKSLTVLKRDEDNHIIEWSFDKEGKE